MSRIIVRIVGGLGNQLFCYAAARRLALANDAELIIDNVSGFRYDARHKRDYQLDYFNIPCRKATPGERLEPFSRIRRYLMRRKNRFLAFESRKYLMQEGIDFDARLLDLKLYAPRFYLEGYWQSEGYFKDIEATIREDLRIRPPTDAVNLAMAQQIKGRKSIALHIRFFDEDNKNGPNNAPRDYYQRAISMMEARFPGAHYFLFSDHPDIAHSFIPLPDDRVTLVRHNQGDKNAYADFWLMSQCQHFIIANSTFSWWAGWLAENPAKIVMAPGFEKRVGINAWGFKGLLPASWIKI